MRAYQAGEKIAADKGASLVRKGGEAGKPGTRISALPRLDFPRIVHQRQADWSTTTAKAAEIRCLCYLWEDVRTAEKLDNAWENYARPLDLSSMEAKGERALRPNTVPSLEARKIARSTLPHIHSGVG